MESKDSLGGLSRAQQVRRERILECAQRLFGQIGIRATTMEAVARESGFSKPTVYGYFADKDAVVHGVAFAIFDRMEESLSRAMQNNARPRDKIVEALQARLGQVYELMIRSPFAQEACEAKSKAIVERSDTLHQTYQQTIRAQIDAIPSKAGQGENLASLLLRASDGLKAGAGSADQLAREVELLVRGILK